MSFRSLHGPVSGNRRSLTIGSDGWLVTIIVLPSLFMVGPFTDRAAAGRLRPLMNFLMRLSLGLEIQIHGSVPPGRRAKDWQNWLSRCTKLGDLEDMEWFVALNWETQQTNCT